MAQRCSRSVERMTIPLSPVVIDDLQYRLPNGDEWTTFAQCGDDREHPWGNEWPPKYGNYSGVSDAGSYTIDGYNGGFPVTCPVEESGKNDWGLHGVGGNVWEWTSELHTDKEQRALRGASWSDFIQGSLLCEVRAYDHPSSRYGYFGFRLLLSR